MNTDQRNQGVSHVELIRVQELIQRCLQLYMTRNEAVDIINRQARVEPAFTEIVWQKLEQENQEFFKAYNLKLMVKDQIIKFNNLLEMQCKLMCQATPAEVAPVHRSNGSHVPPLHRDSGSYAPFQHGSNCSDDFQSTFFNADVSHNTAFAQISNQGMIQGMNELTIASDNGHAGNTHMSPSQQILRNLNLADFAAEFGDNFGDKSSFDVIFGGFDRENFGSD